MKKSVNIISWIGVAFFCTIALVPLTQGDFISAMLILFGGALLAPISLITNFKNKLKLNKIIAVVLAFIFLFVGIAISSPTTEEPSDNPTTSSQVSSDVSQTTNENTENTTTSTSTTPPENDTVSSNPTESKPQDTPQTPSASGVGAGKYNPVSLSNIPAYSGKAYIAVNNNIPNFSADELKSTGYETYSNLDGLGRTQMAIASVGKDTMPKENEKRGDINSIKPSGWNQATYDNVSGKYLYNRCHLIGWQLSAENANNKNLITGTKYLNIDGMLPFENMVADYIKETGNHVAYRITPIYSGNNLLASGVQMEAYSIEDNGEGICFNVYCYNVQPDITINYADGSSSSAVSTPTPKPTPTPDPEPTPNPTPEPDTNTTETVYKSKTGTKYHSKPNCGNMKNGTAIDKDEAIEQGLEPCEKCF